MRTEADPTSLAQALTRAIDESMDQAVLYLEDGPDAEGTTLRVTEIDAQLEHLLGGNVEFTVRTSDGRSFTVRVSEGF